MRKTAVNHNAIDRVKRSIKARALEDLCNCASHKPWKNAIPKLRSGRRRSALAEFCQATGDDCRQNHMYRLRVLFFPRC
ncbi:hypothetical protein TNCV_331761 [Trichonephila clavipes]|nr:hypothetical protein TNCV_331761 [Trichonephila clavipes]